MYNINEYRKNQSVFKPVDIKIDFSELLFKDPFSSIFLGMRGSGKTTFIISFLNYLTKNNNKYDKIYFVTSSSDQKLFDYLEPSDRITFYTLDEFINCKININLANLIIFDDLIIDIKEHKTAKTLLDKFYTTSRHMRNKDIEKSCVSIINLSQHLGLNSLVSKTNSDYLLIFKITDLEVVKDLHRSFATDIQFGNFEKMLNETRENNKPLIISFNEPLFKYRYNFNEMFNNDCEIIKIFKDDEIKIEEKKEIKNDEKNFMYVSVYNIFGKQRYKIVLIDDVIENKEYKLYKNKNNKKGYFLKKEIEKLTALKSHIKYNN
jgi:GTPase SAR1 family protein